MATRKRTSKAKAKAEKTQPTFSTDILPPFWDPDHFKPDGDTADWLEHRRSDIADALHEGFNSEDEEIRQACWMLSLDLERLTRAATHALATGKRVDVHVEQRPGCLGQTDYADWLRWLAIVVAYGHSGDVGSNCGFSDLSDLLVEHVNALGRQDLRPSTGEVAA